MLIVLIITVILYIKNRRLKEEVRILNNKYIELRRFKDKIINLLGERHGL